MKKTMIDLMLMCMSAAIFGIGWAYPQEIRKHPVILWVSAGVALLFLLLAVCDYQREQHGMKLEEAEQKPLLPEMQESGGITEAVLLSEDGTEVMVWDIYNKVSIIIGRDVGENRVEIDLRNSPYASMVDVEHAVLNFAGGSWYVSDLETQNGTIVKKAEDGGEYRISSDVPCLVRSGDCIHIGLNRLLLR